MRIKKLIASAAAVAISMTAFAAAVSAGEAGQTKEEIYAFGLKLDDFNGMTLGIQYKENPTDTTFKWKTKPLSQLIETYVSGGGTANLAIKFTEMPETVQIDRVELFEAPIEDGDED